MLAPCVPTHRIEVDHRFSSNWDHGGWHQKIYIPSIALNAERQGLRVHGSIIFKVMSHCSLILHQFAMQKEGGAPTLTDVKWFLHVQQLRFGNVGAVYVSRCVLNLGLLLLYSAFYIL